MNTSFTISPIATFHSSEQSLYTLPRQPGLKEGTVGVIKLCPHHNFEQALQDLEGFSKIWVLFWFHKAKSWKPKVLPPRGGIKRGLFATRSPHRPNPIGLSCMTLCSIQGLYIYVKDHDLIDQTPIIDIKPYLPYADSYPDASCGWVDSLQERKQYSVTLSPLASKQIQWIEEKCNTEFYNTIAFILSKNPYPYPQNRIEPHIYKAQEGYLLAYKAWRIFFTIQEILLQITIDAVFSGYTQEILEINNDHDCGDISMHRAYFRMQWD